MHEIILNLKYKYMYNIKLCMTIFKATMAFECNCVAL